MFRLTREIRFALTESSAPIAGVNGHGGVPAMDGLAYFFTLRVTLAGELEPRSSYLRNIKEIDQQVRRRAIPAMQELISSHTYSYAVVLKRLREVLAGAWPGAALEALVLSQSPFQSIAWRSSEPSMIRLSQKFEFSAAHRLHNPSLSDAENQLTFGKCNNANGHGHNYEVQVTLAGEPNEAGTLLPVDAFEKIVHAKVIDHLDHKHLNIEVPEFASTIPSVENIAKVIHSRLKSQFPPNVRLASVTVWETPKTWCEYSEQ